MASRQRLVVFDALMLRALVTGQEELFSDERTAFRTAFRGRRFRILVTDDILSEYLKQAITPPQFEPLPALNRLFVQSRAIQLEEYRLNRFSIQITGLPREHSAFIRDAIGAGASYFITKFGPWLSLSEQTQTNYGLIIVTPARFVELEG